MHYFKRVAAQTPTKLWINNATRTQAQMAIDAGAVGSTQNPSYVYKMLTNDEEKEYALAKLDEIILSVDDDDEVQVQLQRELVSGIAKLFMPMFERSKGELGYVSVQGNPFKENVDDIVRCAEFNAQAAPNIMAKIPATKEGLEAIEYVARKGIAINATEVMAVRQALDVCKAYEKATKDMAQKAPIYFSHITGIYDEYLQKVVKERNIDISPDALWQAGMSIAKKTYWMVREKGYKIGFIGGGARGLHHFTEMVGADAVVTINWSGTADKLLEKDDPVVQRFLMQVPYSVVDELVEKIDDYRRGYFVNAICEDEYEDFGPVVLFRQSFEVAWKSADKLIKERRADLAKR